MDDATRHGFKILMPVNPYKAHLAEAHIMTGIDIKCQLLRWLTFAHPKVPLMNKIAPEYLRIEVDEATEVIHKKILKNLYFKPLSPILVNYSFLVEFKKCSKSISLAEQAKLDENVLKIQGQNKIHSLYLGKDKILPTRMN